MENTSPALLLVSQVLTPCVQSVSPRIHTSTIITVCAASLRCFGRPKTDSFIRLLTLLATFKLKDPQNVSVTIRPLDPPIAQAAPCCLTLNQHNHSVTFGNRPPQSIGKKSSLQLQLIENPICL